MRTSTRISAAVAATALSLALAACGGNSGAAGSATSASTSSSASSTVAAQHNAADVSFTQNMIVHHQGAIAMAELAATRASSQQVKDLAKKIEAAQTPEIDEMTSWLKTWGEPATASGGMSGSMPGMDHGSMPSGSMGSTGPMGMMTDEQMGQLKAATGREFDRMFLQMMITHHQGAIDMAKTEQANGSNPQAIALAKSIDTSQTAEVTQMNQMLQNLGS
jgi:uncharacterized protein (DUF305 family)